MNGATISTKANWLQGRDSNPRSCGYEPHGMARLSHPAGDTKWCQQRNAGGVALLAFRHEPRAARDASPGRTAIHGKVKGFPKNKIKAHRVATRRRPGAKGRSQLTNCARENGRTGKPQANPARRSGIPRRISGRRWKRGGSFCGLPSMFGAGNAGRPIGIRRPIL